MKRKIFIILMGVLLLLTVSGCSQIASNNKKLPLFSSEIPKTDKLLVHFIDVGQGNAILIEMPNQQKMLIDAGSKEASKAFFAYLKKEKIQKIDYLIATHPHEDHIGNINGVLKNIATDNFYMPQVTANTKTFKDIIDTVKDKKMKINKAKKSLLILEDKALGLKAEFLAPCSTDYEKLNDYSAVVKITYKNTAVLITGDAEIVSEKEMLKEKTDLKADVLQIGHHGSISSTSKAFLKAVKPEYAVICVGRDNSYGHPHQEILDRLMQGKVQIFRTDHDGSLVMWSDGNKIVFYDNSN